MRLKSLLVVGIVLSMLSVAFVMAQEEKPHWSYEAEGETSPAMWYRENPIPN